jgi:hypothetical protein
MPEVVVMEPCFRVIVLARIYSDTSPPKRASFLPPLCSVFKERMNQGRDTRPWRRFSQVEKLPNPDRKQIVQILDAFLEREKLKKAS